MIPRHRESLNEARIIFNEKDKTRKKKINKEEQGLVSLQSSTFCYHRIFEGEFVITSDPLPKS